ncbi:hypothetical protein RJ639_046070 [Escallonia herrerae]|uniref:Peroxisomal membrane protein PMP22 n=1 Tax=Escallonia herrerae TaxID=1293975 RepID=A0AA88W9E0_9ASTE|nr:hypothetical protein RJ639_046070 [Escallonia herrerae]
MGSIAKKGLQQYLLQLQQQPLRTKALTAGVLSAISDIVSQRLSGIQKLQRKRLLLKVCDLGLAKCLFMLIKTVAFPTVIVDDMLFGFAYLGPFGHFYHILLDKLFKGKKDNKTVAQKVVLEQLTSSPLNNLLFMLYYGLVIEERPWVQVKSKIKKEYPTVQYAAWTFWPVVGWINHRHVPLQFRVILQSFVAFCWGIFLNLRAKTVALTKD